MPSNDLHATWGERLTQAREALGLSIRELARRTDVHPSHLARFENGEARLGDAKRIRVATEVGQRVEDLFPYPDTIREAACLNADSAQEEGTSRTRPTTAARRSNARSVGARAGSGPEGSPGSE